MDIQPLNARPVQLLPASTKVKGEEATGDSVEVGNSQGAAKQYSPAELPDTTPKSGAENGLAEMPPAVLSGPVPNVTGAAFQAIGINSLLGWFKKKPAPNSESSQESPLAKLPQDVTGPLATELGDLGPEYLEGVGKSAGDSTFKERYDLFMKVKSTFRRCWGRDMSSDMMKFVLQQYEEVTKSLHRGASFKTLAGIYESVSDCVNMSEGAGRAFEIMHKTLGGKPEEQGAFLGILRNTGDPGEAKKFFDETKKLMLGQSWEDRRDAMIALTDVLCRMHMEYFAAKPKLMAIEAYRMCSKNRLHGESIKAAAEEFAGILRPSRQISDYHDFCVQSMSFWERARKLKLPLEERTLLLDSFARFRSDYEAENALALVKEPSGSTSFAERSGIMREIMAREYSGSPALEDYRFVRENTRPGESMTDVAKPFTGYLNACRSYEFSKDARDAFLFMRNDLKEDKENSAFFTYLLECTGMPGRAGNLYQLLSKEPILDEPFRGESVDERREVLKTILTQYFESEHYKSVRGGKQLKDKDVVKGAIEDHKFIRSMTRDNERLKETTDKFVSLIQLSKRSHFSKDAQTAMAFIRNNLGEAEKDTAYFTDLFGRIGDAERAVKLCNDVTSQQLLDSPVMNESRETRRDVFTGLLFKYVGHYDSQCLQKTERYYDLILRFRNIDEPLEEAALRIQSLGDSLREMKTFQDRGDVADLITFMGRLRWPGETIDDTYGRVTGAVVELEKQDPYDGFDDMWFTDYTRPIYEGLKFLAEAQEEGLFPDTPSKEVFTTLMKGLSSKNSLREAYEMLELFRTKGELSKTAKNLSEAGDKDSTHFQDMGDSIVIGGIKLKKHTAAD